MSTQSQENSPAHANPTLPSFEEGFGDVDSGVPCPSVSRAGPNLPSFEEAFGNVAPGLTRALQLHSDAGRELAEHSAHNPHHASSPETPTNLNPQPSGRSDTESAILPKPRDPPMCRIELEINSPYSNKASKPHLLAARLERLGYFEPEEWSYWRCEPLGNLETQDFVMAMAKRLFKASQQVGDVWPLPLPHELKKDFTKRQRTLRGRTDFATMISIEQQFRWTQTNDPDLKAPANYRAGKVSEEVRRLIRRENLR